MVSQRPLQILYVEDSPTAQALMRRQLHGSTLVMAKSPRAAVECMDTTKFDVVITDFQLDDGDAFQVIEHVRRNADRTELPIIVVSASMDRDLHARVVNAGANMAMTKVHNISMRDAVLDILENPLKHTKAPFTVNTVRCFSWVQNGICHVFSPEAQVSVTDTNFEAAKAKLKEALKSAEIRRRITLAHSEKVFELGLH